jgi:hypothetical protein
MNRQNRPSENHRDPYFDKFLMPIFEDVKYLFQSKAGQPFIFPATGTGAWESALTNCLSPGCVFHLPFHLPSSAWRPCDSALNTDQHPWARASGREQPGALCRVSRGVLPGVSLPGGCVRHHPAAVWALPVQPRGLC